MASVTVDTLVCDSALLHQYQTDETYNYSRELYVRETNVMDWLTEKIERFFNDTFSPEGGDDVRWFVYGIIALAVIAAVGYLVYRKRAWLFGRMGKGEKKTASADEDTIYGIDFNGELARALARGDYYNAVRMVYLRTLRRLFDRKLIDWRIYKTPTEYTRELPSDDFRRMTLVFMRVRYGNYPASADAVADMQRYEDALNKEGGGV